jgi:hypothetical protein
MESEPAGFRRVDDVLDYVYERLADGRGAHLDQDLEALGDRIAETQEVDQVEPESAERLALDAWRVADPMTRQTLAHVAMRVVGHEHFRTEEDVR